MINDENFFEQIKNSLLDYDPAHFIENNLKVEGDRFTVLENGWKFMADIYRYVALQATQKNGKPIIIKKGRQVGATIMASALDLYFTNSGLFTKPPIRVAHLFPTIPLRDRFVQEKLENMIRSSKDNFVNKNKIKNSGMNGTDNMTIKQFNTGTLWIESIGADGDRVRGMTIDVGFFDEVQDMPGDAINTTTKTLTAAKYGPVGKGVQIYFGTPKDKDSWFAKTWEQSDQRYYHLGCPSCKKFFPLYTPNSDNWKTIWPEKNVIICPLCKAQTDKCTAIDLGKWVSTRNEKDAKFVGFHINQFYIPYFTRENINELMPENNPNQSEMAWNNEVIGEFYAGVGMPLTRSHIELYCKDPDRRFSSSISPRDHKRTYLGVDWGDKVDGEDRGQSFSCIVILSDTGNGVLSVEFAHKLRKRDFEYKRDIMNELYRRYSISRGVGDFNFGQEITEYMNSHYGTTFIGAQGAGNTKVPLKYDDGDLCIRYNKDYLIEELFEKMKKGKVRFPWADYDKFDWLIEHCTSMGTKLREISGQPIKTYVKGGTPNDGLMALMYAYMAWKFDATNGFTIKPGIKTELDLPMPSLAYSPGIRNSLRR